MTTVLPSPCSETRQQRRRIDRHFSRRITPRSESIMRSHLPDCASCTRYYERHMMLAGLTPSRPRMADRLAVGLGIFHAAPSRRQARFGLLVTATAAACVAILMARGGDGLFEEEFAPRGGTALQEGPHVEIYRVAVDGSAGHPASWMSPTDELAFAYRNPSGFAHLMVFGVDDTQRVYWFHPAWSHLDDDPKSVPIRSGTGPFELPEAIAHDIQGLRLRIVALFTNEPISVRNMEQRLKAGGADPEGAIRVETVLEVRR